jgi:glutamine amidotransferase
MTQFVALSTNSREYVGCSLALHADDLMLPPIGEGVFGLGYYDSGELLARMSPREPGRPLDVANELAALEAEVFVLHTGPTASSEDSRHEDVQPFRFQDWLMARTGEIAGFDDFCASIVGTMPPFIRRGMCGNTPDEHFFHLFLSFLFDAGRIGRSNVGTAEIRRALGQAIAAVDAFAEATGHRPSDFSAVVSDGYSLVVTGRGVPLRYALIEGIRDCGVCRDSRQVSAGGGTGMDHEEVRGVLIVSGSARASSGSFTQLGSGEVLSVTPDTKVEFHTLEQLAGC